MASYFPLSNRPRRDETDVTSNWARHRGTVLLDLAGALETLSAEEWELPALRADTTVRSVIAELVWRSTTTRWQRLRSTPAAVPSSAELVQAVRTIATADLAAAAKRTPAELGDAVVAAFELTAVTGAAVTVDPVASGSVALARAVSGPIGIRSVMNERTLRATDADWQVGRGQEIAGSAAAIVLYMYGRAPLER